MGLDFAKIDDFVTDHCVDNIEELSIVDAPDNDIHLCKEVVQNFTSLRSVSFSNPSVIDCLNFISTLGDK